MAKQLNTPQEIVAHLKGMPYKPAVAYIGADTYRVQQMHAGNEVLGRSLIDQVLRIEAGGKVTAQTVLAYTMDGEVMNVADCNEANEPFEAYELDSYAGYVGFDAVFG